MKKTTLFYGETGVYSCRTEERGRFDLLAVGFLPAFALDFSAACCCPIL